MGDGGKGECGGISHNQDILAIGRVCTLVSGVSFSLSLSVLTNHVGGVRESWRVCQFLDCFAPLTHSGSTTRRMRNVVALASQGDDVAARRNATQLETKWHVDLSICVCVPGVCVICCLTH